MQEEDVQTPELTRVDETLQRLVPVTPAVRDVIVSLVQRSPARGLAALDDDDTLDVELRDRLAAVLQSPLLPAEMAARLGDELRAYRQELNADAIECYRAAFYLGEAWEELAANPLFARFAANKSYQPFDKWVHYFDIYSRVLAPYVGKPVKVLEIGVFHGGGLDQLRFLLGDQATLIGADVDPSARDACAGRFEVEVGDQTDEAFLDAVVAKHGPFDVIIDDGGHSMRQQIVTIERLFPTLNNGGVYIVEDTHTSYWEAFQDHPQTFMDWVKDRIDDINAYHHSPELELPVWTTEVNGIHVFDSVVVFDRKHRFAPFCEVAGTGSFALADRISESALLSYRAALGSAVQTAAAAQRERDAAVGAAVENARQREVQSLELHQEIANMEHSLSWRLTAPLRRLRKGIRAARESD